jgi:hypothetical protein
LGGNYRCDETAAGGRCGRLGCDQVVLQLAGRRGTAREGRVSAAQQVIFPSEAVRRVCTGLQLLGWRVAACTAPDMPRGPVLATPTPHHSGTDDSEGGPLWLQVQGYGLHVMLRQDHQLVSATGVLVTTRTGFPLQVRPAICKPGDGRTGDGGHTFDTSCGVLHHFPGFGTAVPRR